MNDRIRLLLSFLNRKRVDAVLLTSPISIHYYTTFHGFSLDEREGFALVTKKHVYILTSKLYEGAVMSLPGVIADIYSSDRPFTPLLTKLLQNNHIKSLGVEANNLTLAEYLNFKKLTKIVPLQIRSLRVKKTDEEIVMIQKACRVADNAYEKVVPSIKPGMTETQISSLLEQEIRNQGSTISFRPIVAFGENAAIPHHLTSDKRLHTNDLILIDFGAKIEGYCSDMTRTFFLGKPAEEQKKVYDAVLSAQKAAIDYLNQELRIKNYGPKTKDVPAGRQGQRLKTSAKLIKTSDVDSVARDYIISNGYSSIPHSLGHGIGLEVHEPPYLGPGSKDVLEEGMVFSIEPGIYLPAKFGVRIEDLFAIQKGKLVQLTHSPKPFS